MGSTKNSPSGGTTKVGRFALSPVPRSGVYWGFTSRRRPAMQPAAPPNLDDPALYINRDLSWLEFNRRVLEEAQDTSVPMLERLKFLAIVSSNLDEFFMVRVGNTQQK